MEVGSLIRRAAQHFKDAPCLVEGARVVSFREFDDLTDRLGNGLLRSGLVPGDRVGVLMPNGIDCLIAYYALAKSGLVRVSLNVREKPKDHAYKLEDSGSRAIFCSEHEIVPEGIELCFRPAAFLDRAESERAAMTFLVPSMIAMVMEEPRCAVARLTLRRIVYGASPIADGLLRRAETRFGKLFAQTSGQAESPMVITCLRPADHDRIGSCGRPFPTVEAGAGHEDRNFLGP